VSTVADLTSALANTAVGRIVLASGTYNLRATLGITRSVTLEAAAGATVILNAQASSSSPFRVLYINPGSSGVVQLIGLGITGGYIYNVHAHVQKFPSPRWENALLTCPFRFSSFMMGVLPRTTVWSTCYLRLKLQKFPSPMGDPRVARCLQGAGVYVNDGTVSIVNSQIYSNTAPQVRVPATPANFHHPDGKIADMLALNHASVTTANDASVNYRRCVAQ